MERTENKQTENEQTEVAAHIAKAKENTGAAATEVSLGKFKDVGSLLKAYENLESEFTRRSRRLKELEGEVLRNREEITRRGASSVIPKGLGEGSSPEKADETKSGGGEKDKREGDSPENAAAETPEKGAESDGRIDDENRKSAEKEDGKTDGIADSAEKTDEKGEKTEKSEGAADGYNAMEEIIKKYLLSIIKSRPPVTPASGTAVVVPPRKPKSFEEAGMLVKKDFGL